MRNCFLALFRSLARMFFFSSRCRLSGLNLLILHLAKVVSVITMRELYTSCNDNARVFYNEM